jgi:GT2 family glycosyltransferase
VNYLIITNTFQREFDLVQKSVTASLREVDSTGHLLLIDQNKEPLKFESNNQFTHIHYQRNSVSSARNRVLTLDWVSNYDWLIFCDDDGRMDNGYVNIFYDILKNNPNLEAIAGSIIRDDNLDYYSPRHRIGGSLKNFRHTKLLMGSNFAVKREVFSQLGGFDERFGAGAYYGSGEETDFCWKCYFSNIEMEFFQNLRILHIKPHAGSIEHSIEKAYRYGFGKGALVGKWLINEKKAIVLYEAVEMIVIPLARVFLGLLKLQKLEIRLYKATVLGRIKGFFSFLSQ